MLLTNKTAIQLLGNQTHLRNTYTALTKSWLLIDHTTQNTNNSGSVLVDVLVRRCIKSSKKEVLYKKSKKTKKIIKKHGQFLYRKRIPSTGTSFNVLFLYNLFFWSTISSGATRIFRKREKGITNRYSSIYSNRLQNHQSINRKFSRTYKSIQNKGLFKVSQPLTISLFERPKKKKNKYSTVKAPGHKKIIASILGSFLPKINRNQRHKTYRNVCQKKIEVYKTSKIVYSLNHYALNTLLSI